MGSVGIGCEEQAPVVACGGGLHTVLHCSLNGEGLNDLAAVIQPTNTISGQVRQGQESLHLYIHLQKHQLVDNCHSPCRPASWPSPSWNAQVKHSGFINREEMLNCSGTLQGR